MYRSVSLGFTGECEDCVTRAYPLGSGYRLYLPALMRCNAPDSESPFGAGGIHPYSYCADDPIDCIDPTGHVHVSFSSYGLPAEETINALNEMDAREAAAHQTAQGSAIATLETAAEPRASAEGAAPVRPSAGGRTHRDGPSGSGAIGVHHPVISTASSWTGESTPGMQAQTSPLRPPHATVRRVTTAEQILKAAKPERGDGRRIVRARAVGVMRALQEHFPGEVKSITTLPGYKESKLIRYLGTPAYETMRSMMRRYSSVASGPAARAEWRRIAPYFGVDVSDV